MTRGIPLFRLTWTGGDAHSRFFMLYLVCIAVFAMAGPPALVVMHWEPVEAGFSMAFALIVGLGLSSVWYPAAYVFSPVIRRILALPALSARSRELYSLMEECIQRFGSHGRPAGLLAVAYLTAAANLALIGSSVPVVAFLGASPNPGQPSLSALYYAMMATPFYAVLYYVGIHHSRRFAQLGEELGYPLLSIRNYGARQRSRAYKAAGRLVAIHQGSEDGISGALALYETRWGTFRIHVVGADGRSYFVPSSAEEGMSARDVATRFPNLWKEAERAGPIPAPT